MGCELRVDWLGRVLYPEALEIQAKCVEARRTGAAPDRLLLLEHPAVITLGRSAGREHVRASSDELRTSAIKARCMAMSSGPMRQSLRADSTR